MFPKILFFGFCFFSFHKASPSSLQGQIEVLECIYPRHSTEKKTKHMGPHNKSQLYIFERLVCAFYKDKRLCFNVVDLLKKQKREQVERRLVLTKHRGTLNWSITEETYQKVTTSQNHRLFVFQVVFVKRWSSTFDWREESWQQKTKQMHRFQRGLTMRSNCPIDKATIKKDQIVTICFSVLKSVFSNIY